MESPDSTRQEKSATTLHQSETHRQIYLPFIVGLILILIAVLSIILVGDSVWRTRASAIADWIYSALCLFPLLLCFLPLYLILMIAIYGLTRLHAGTERPLQKLENASAKLAERINVAMNYINEKTIAFNTATAPLDDLLSGFDMPSDEEELDPDDRTE